VGFGPTRARSNRAGVSMCTMRRRSTAGRPVVTRRMLVRPQPSQPHVRFVPRSSNGRGRRSLTPEARVRFPLGVLHDTLSDASGICGPVVSRVRRVRFPSRALLAVAQWMSAALLPRAMEVRLLPARLRRKACSEPAGCESVEQGAIPWRRPIQRARHAFAATRPRSGRLQGSARSEVRASGFRSAPAETTTGRLGKRRSDTAVERGSIPRSSTSRTPPGPRPGSSGASGAERTGCRRMARGSDGTTAGRSAGRNVHPASLRGGSPAAATGGWQACRRATDGFGDDLARWATSPPPIEGSQALLLTFFWL